MSLKIDRLQLEIIINNDQARKSLRSLDDEARAIQKSMKGMKEGTDEWIQATKRLASIKTQMDSIQDSIGITGLTVKELIAKQKELNMVLNNISPNLPAYKQYRETLDQVNGRLSELKGKAKESGGTLNEMFGSLSPTIMKLGAAAAAAFSLDAIKEYVKGGVEAAIKLRDTENLLLEELNGQKSVQNDLINLAKKRAGTSMYSRVEIEEAEKFLAIQERTPEQIKKTIDAAVNLAALTGGSLNDSVKDLDATMEGRLGKGLGKLERDFKGLTKEQMYNGDAIDIVAKKYAGLAEREMNTTEGRLNLLSKAWKGLQRSVGETVMSSGGLFSGLIDSVTNTLKKMSTGVNEFNASFKTATQTYEEHGRSVAILVKDIDPLLTRYDELKKKTNLSKKEQEEMKGIVEQVTAIMPGAATAFDKYGTAVSISSDRVRDFMKGQLQLLRYENKQVIKETISDLAGMNLAVKQSKETMDQIAKSGTFKVTETKTSGRGATGSSITTTRNANNEEIQEATRKNQELINNQIALNTKLKELNGDALQQAIVSYDKEKLAKKKDDEDAAHKKIDITKMTESELNEVISRAREDSATNIDRTNARLAQRELNRREGLAHSYSQYMELMKEIADLEKTNFAEKLSQTENEIRVVNEKYNNEIDKIRKYQQEKKKELTPAQNKELNSKVGELEVIRDAQTKQVLEQAEQDFSEKVRVIHENLRVARMSITQREVYDINKKYDDLQKEIIDAIEYRYQQEINQANGNTELIKKAEQNKVDALAKMDGDLSKLEQARQEETNKARKAGEVAFLEELNNLKQKAEKDQAKGEEKIRKEVNARYKKLLDDNVNDVEKTAQIKEQIEKETADEIADYQVEKNKKIIDGLIKVAQQMVSSLSGVASAWASYQNAIYQREEDNNNKAKTNLKKQLDAKLISQKNYDAQVAALDAAADKKKRKMMHDQAVVNKAINIANAIINTAVAVTANLAMPALAIVVGALGAIEVALIAATPVPEAATGRYNVIGQQDGKTYRNVPYESSFTGIPGRPMLVNETGNEIVIDPYTTRNIVMNYPHVLAGIRSAMVPQRASGQYPDWSKSSTSDGTYLVQFHPETLQAMKSFEEQLRHPIQSTMNYDTMMYSINRVAEIESGVTR